MHKTQPRDFPGSAVVKTALSVQGSIPGGEAKILHATWHDQPPPQPPPHENKTKNPKKKQRVKQTNKKPSTNACYGSVVFQRNHCLLLPGILKIVFIDTCYMAGTLHHNILGVCLLLPPPRRRNEGSETQSRSHSSQMTSEGWARSGSAWGHSLTRCLAQSNGSALHFPSSPGREAFSRDPRLLACLQAE